MTERLDDAITRLAELSGWKPEKAADHLAAYGEQLADKADERARAAALKTFAAKPAGRKAGRGRQAAGAGA